MNMTAIKIASLIALVVAVCPSLLYFVGILDIDTMKWIMLGGTIAWLAIAPAWLGRERQVDDDQVQI